MFHNRSRAITVYWFCSDHSLWGNKWTKTMPGNYTHGRISIWHLSLLFSCRFLFNLPPMRLCIFQAKSHNRLTGLTLQLLHVMLDIYNCPACPELFSCFQQITIIELTSTPTKSHICFSSALLKSYPPHFRKRLWVLSAIAYLTLSTVSLLLAVAIIILSKPVFSRYYKGLTLINHFLRWFSKLLLIVPEKVVSDITHNRQ